MPRERSPARSPSSRLGWWDWCSDTGFDPAQGPDGPGILPDSPGAVAGVGWPTIDSREATELTEERRILILGQSRAPRGVVAHAWSDLPSDLNVADFNIVLMDLSTLDASPSKSDVERISGARMARLLFRSESRVYVLDAFGPDWRTNVEVMARLWWLPVQVDVVRDRGGDISTVATNWTWFFRPGTGYHQFVSSIKVLQDYGYVREAGYSVGDLSGSFEAIASTGFGRPIALLVQLSIFEGMQVVRRSQPLILLPKPDGISTDECVAGIFERELGIPFAEAEPEWAAPYVLPTEEKAMALVTASSGRVDDAEAELASAELNLRVERRWRPLLFGAHQQLHDIVVDALCKLGASVLDREERFQDDGRLFAPSGAGVILEITGLTKGLSMDKVRQLASWRNKALIEDAWEAKALLVVNAERGTHPSERSGALPESALAEARRLDVAVLTTLQIFHALSEAQQSSFEPDAWWFAVISTSGACAVRSAA